MMGCLGCRHMQRAYSPPTSLAVSTCNSDDKGSASGIGNDSIKTHPKHASNGDIMPELKLDLS